MDISTFIAKKIKALNDELQYTKDAIVSMDTDSGLKKDYENHVVSLNYIAEVYRLAEIGLQVEVLTDE